MTTVARRAYGGIVKHPLSGKVEFTGRPELAIEVAKVLDEHDPVTAEYIYEMWSAMPSHDRYRAEWFAPLVVINNIRQLDWNPPSWSQLNNPGAVETLFGRPIHQDENVEGLTLRVGANA